MSPEGEGVRGGHNPMGFHTGGLLLTLPRLLNFYRWRKHRFQGVITSETQRVLNARVHEHRHQHGANVAMRLIHCKWIGFDEAGFRLRRLSRLDLELQVWVTQTATGIPKQPTLKKNIFTCF